MSLPHVFTFTLARIALAGLVPLALHACDDASLADRTTALGSARADVASAGQHRVYGAPVQVGAARARTYVVLDERAGGIPLEMGVALDADALEGLPDPMPMPPGGGMDHADAHRFELPLPPRHGTPYRFVELDWNPGGHGYPYTQAHFDFHFYTVDRATRDGIDTARMSAAEYAARSAAFPGAAEVPPFYVPLVPPGTQPRAVQRMGLHWGDVRSPELQVIAGNAPAYRPFTTTFFRGSWDGRFIFDEPMVTRAFLLARRAASAPAQRDSVMPLPTAASYAPEGYHPTGYRVAWDEEAREYRIGLGPLARRD